MARRAKDHKPGYGKLLDAWAPPENAGSPIGCLATTFTFSSVFFEEECLGRFLGLESDPNEDGPLYLVEREEKLSGVQCAAALVDQHHCKGSRSLRWDLVPVRPPRGLLHAKVCLLYWAECVRVIISSANLTKDGYRRNQEVFGKVDYYPTGHAPLALLRGVVEFLRTVEGYARTPNTAPPPPLVRVTGLLDRVGDTLDAWNPDEKQLGRKDLRVHPVFSGPEMPSVFETLDDLWPGASPPTDASVVSPFFDPAEGPNKPARQLWRRLRRRGKATVEFHTTAEEIPGQGSYLVHAPASLETAESSTRSEVSTDFYRVELEPDRRLHAKSIWLQDDRWVLYMIGSSNFTSAGLGLGLRVNLEANIAYCVDARRNAQAADALGHAFPESSWLDPAQGLRWQPRRDEGEDAPGDAIPLPPAFADATYGVSVEEGASITLRFAGVPPPPAGWKLIREDDESEFFSAEKWEREGRAPEVTLTWPRDRPPYGFSVTWEGCHGAAWWPVNIAETGSLPPPDELRDLHLEALIHILSSARPLHRVLGGYLRKRKPEPETGDRGGPEIDPHKRVDTSTFLLQRTRRVSRALNALRERLERPVATEQSLDWRLRGPVGVRAVARALRKEARSEEERAFLLSELALELNRVRPRSVPGYLDPARVEKAIRLVIEELKEQIPVGMPESVRNLETYVKEVFRQVLR